MESLLSAIKAAGEPTRLRIVAILARSELTVGELCRVLGQTQPRVSRHLKLLCDADVLSRNAQGTSAYFRPARTGIGRQVFDAMVTLIDPDDPILTGDLRRLDTIRAERAEAAANYFEKIAGDWEAMRLRHVGDDEVEAAMVAAVDDLEIGVLLDIGTGTGRVLEVFAPKIEQGIGIDLSNQMLNLARSRLDELGFRHCSVRQGNAYDTAVTGGSADVAVVHHVLHYLDDPAACIREAARTLRPGGRLLIVDFASHNVESLRADYSHRWLGFASRDISDWAADAGLVDLQAEHLALHDSAEAVSDESLTVTLWVATQNENAPQHPTRADAT